MHLNGLTDWIVGATGRKPGTIHDYAKDLRAAGRLSTGKQGPYGGAHMTSADAINLLLASVLDHERGEDAAASVDRVRDLPLEKPPIQLSANLSIGLSCFDVDTAGNALDFILDDVRSGRFEAWAAGERWSLSVTIECRGGSVYISLRKPEARFENEIRVATESFAQPDYDGRRRSIERHVTIDRAVFLQLAAALGPPP